MVCSHLEFFSWHWSQVLQDWIASHSTNITWSETCLDKPHYWAIRVYRLLSWVDWSNVAFFHPVYWIRHILFRQSLRHPAANTCWMDTRFPNFSKLLTKKELWHSLFYSVYNCDHQLFHPQNGHQDIHNLHAGLVACFGRTNVDFFMDWNLLTWPAVNFLT